MSNYIFTPGPTVMTTEYEYLTWEDGFSDEEINKIVDIGESLIPQNASVNNVGDGKTTEEIRRSEVSWLTYDNADWVYDRLAFIARRLNTEFYHFDLHGFVEDFQYTVYRGEVEGHYDWHIDKGNLNNTSPRKLSLVMQLSEPADYEGGDLELWTANEPVKIPKKKGLVVAFPSYVLHRVTPVTKGIRRSLVIWTAGPAFK